LRPSVPDLRRGGLHLRRPELQSAAARRSPRLPGRRRWSLLPAVRIRPGLPGGGAVLPDARPVLRRRFQLQRVRPHLPRGGQERLPG